MELIGGSDIERLGREIPRITARYPVDLEVTWFLPKSGLALRPRPVQARLIDLSLAGAAIEIPYESKLSVGDTASLELSGRRGRVQIRHISRPVDAPSLMHLGVSFIRLDDELRDAIHNFVDRQSELRSRRNY